LICAAAALSACGGGSEVQPGVREIPAAAPVQPTAHATAQAAAGARTWVVAPSGNDGNAGSPAAPWRSLARVQAALDRGDIGAGDAVLFTRGGIYPGSLRLGSAQSGRVDAPVMFGATGSGNAPVLSGLVRVQGWQPAGNGRWRASCTACQGTPALLVADGRSVPIARWPNLDEADRGYRYFTASNGSTSITDAAGLAGRNWVGGELVVRSIAWVLDRLPIRSHAGGVITVSQAASYPLEVGYGYFVQNHPEAIDREGEWAYEPASRTLTLQSARDPNLRTIEVPAVADLVELRYASHIVFSGLALQGAQRRGIEIYVADNIVLEGLSSVLTGDHGLRAEGASRITLRDSRFADSMNNGVSMTRCADCRLERLRVENSGTIAGMGAGGDGAYVGVQYGGLAGRPALARQLLVRASGYIGINVTDHARLEASQVRDFNRVKVDGAGIYSYRASSVDIIDNLVLDAGGSTAGTPWASTGTHGIYIDDDSQAIVVRGNTVGNVGAAGIYLHNTRQVLVEDNTLYRAAEAGLLMTDDRLGDFGLENTTVRGNRIVVTGVPMMEIRSDLNNGLFDTLGTIDANRWCDPFGDATVRVALPRGTQTLLLDDWRAAHGHDRNTRVCPERRAAFAVIGTPGAQRVANGDFETDLAGWFGWPADRLDTRWEAGRLDDGSLRLGHAGSTGEVHFDTPVGAVGSAQQFLLEFSSQGIDGSTPFDVYLRQGGEPYQRLGATIRLPGSRQRREHRLLLRADSADAEALLIFELRQPGSALAIDNVRLRPVTAWSVPLTQVARLHANPNPTERSIVVNGGDHVDLEGRRYLSGSSLTLPPWRSIVLIRL
jgi:parallel beta-helix repeat protein